MRIDFFQSCGHCWVFQICWHIQCNTLIASSFTVLNSSRRQWHPTPVLLPGKSHGWRSLVGCSPWGRWVGHDWETSLSLFTFMHWRRKWQPTPVFLPGEFQGRGSLVGCHLWGSHRVGHYWSDLAAAATTGIPSHSLALLTAMLPKAHLSSHSKMSGSGWLTTSS